MSIYNTPHQAHSRAPDYSPHLRASKPKAPSTFRVNTNSSINERIHLIKERTHLKELQISSAPNTKSLSKRVCSPPASHRASGILNSKSNELATNYGHFSKASHFLKKEARISNAIAAIESPEELEKRRNWEICQAKLRERNPEAIDFSPIFRKNTENQKKLTQKQIDKNQQILNSISCLDLSSSELTFFPPDFLSLLPNLKSLYIDKNNLKTISFKPNRENHLTELNISRNQIHELPAEIEFFTKLQELDVSHNNLSSIPDQIYSLVHLNILNVSKNQITEISYLIGQLSKLESLLIRENKLTKIPAEINHLTNLVSFTASDNLISEIPPLNNLAKLQILNLSNNQITSIGNELVGCNIRELFLYHNLISSISPEINSLSLLKRMILKNNQLKTLPSEITQLPFLIDLKVQHNPLETLPASMPNLKTLYRFDYSPQFLTTLDPGLTAWLENFEFKFEGQGVTHLSRIEFT